MTGFQAPNYTQVPNDYFDLIMEMTEAEIKILSVLIRSTFGYHRDEIQVSVRELATATKMSTSSVWIGAEKLESRGLIERSVSKSNTVTNWRVVISDTKLYRQIVKTVSVDSEEKRTLPLERKKEKKEEDDPEGLPPIAKIASSYESEIGLLTPMIADELREACLTYPEKWILDAIHEAAVQNKRGWKYVLAILTRWKAQGNQEAMKKPVKNYKQKAPAEPKAFDAIRRFMEKQEVVDGESTGYIEGHSTP